MAARSTKPSGKYGYFTALAVDDDNTFPPKPTEKLTRQTGVCLPGSFAEGIKTLPRNPAMTSWDFPSQEKWGDSVLLPCAPPFGGKLKRANACYHEDGQTSCSSCK
uniref:Uncharacterized protein n=1 Tax=viral metagenome TaxID=1070528 RepID=A0A6C0JXX9_9ZZZZ